MTFNNDSKNVPQETVGTATPSFGKSTVQVPSAMPQTFDIPDYSYGREQNTLNAQESLRNRYLPKVGTFNITSTGLLSVSGVGFPPKFVQVFASKGAGTVWSQGFCDGTVQECLFTAYDGANYNTDVSQNLLLSINDNVNSTSAVFSSFDPDGFSVNVTSAGLAGKFFYIAQG